METHLWASLLRSVFSIKKQTHIHQGNAMFISHVTVTKGQSHKVAVYGKCLQINYTEKKTHTHTKDLIGVWKETSSKPLWACLYCDGMVGGDLRQSLLVKPGDITTEVWCQCRLTGFRNWRQQERKGEEEDGRKKDKADKEQVAIMIYSCRLLKLYRKLLWVDVPSFLSHDSGCFLRLFF